MEHFSHLWLFFLMVLGIIVLPGLDMAFVLASSLTSGRRAGLVAVAGIVAGGMCHVAAPVSISLSQPHICNPLILSSSFASLMTCRMSPLYEF